MGKAAQVSWFEIPVTDMDRAIAFYETVFGIEIKKVNFGGLMMGWFPQPESPEAATGTLIQHEMYTPKDNGTLLYFHSEDLAIELGRVAAAGGQVFLEKREIGEGHGFMGVFIDCEGNRIALHSQN